MAVTRTSPASGRGRSTPRTTCDGAQTGRGKNSGAISCLLCLPSLRVSSLAEMPPWPDICLVNALALNIVNCALTIDGLNHNR